MNSTTKYNALVAAAQFNRPAAEILLDLIAVFGETRLPANKVRFYEARPVDQRPKVLTDEDSFVRAEIDPAFDYRFPGEDGFLYRRLHLGQVPVRDNVQVIAPEFPFTVHSILPQINTLLQTQLLPEDLVNETYEIGATELRIRATAHSWCWTGSVVVPAVFTGNIPFGARLTEDGRPRMTEDGAFRIIESSN